MLVSSILSHTLIGRNKGKTNLAQHGATRGPMPKLSHMLTVDLPETQEVDTIPAKSKGLLAALLADGPCLVEDISLKFNAFGWYASNGSKILQVGSFVDSLAAYEDKHGTTVIH